MRSLKPVGLAILLLTFGGLASAQFIGPSNVKVASVAEVQQRGIEDQFVELRGRLLRKLGHEKYEFSDGAGSIRVEIDDEIFPPAPIDDKTQVLIQGEVEKEFLISLEIDVKSIRQID